MPTNVWLSGDWSWARETQDAFAAAGEAQLVSSAELADVVVHLAAGNPRAELISLRRRVQAPVVLLVGAGTADLLDAELEGGPVDVLVRPQPPGAVVFAARRAAVAAARRRAEQPDGRVVTVFSPKGGAGKSVVSSNLATLFAERGRRTLLVDCDLQFGDAAIMLGLEPQRTLHDLLAVPGPVQPERIGDCAIRHRSGLDVLAAPLDPEEAESIADEQIGELLAAARGAYDEVVVDTMPFFHGAVLSAVDRSDEVLVVCTPDVPTLKNVRLALQTLDLLGVDRDRVRVVLNRASARVGYRAAQVAAALEREVEIELPEDEAVAVAVNQGSSVGECRAGSPFARAIGQLADRLAPPKVEPRRRLFALGGRR
jgi:pilus assembly protein CpaE